jgi:hypothetical protein
MGKLGRLTKKEFDFLNSEYGMFNNSHHYNLSEKGIKTRPLSLHFWAVAYLADTTTDNLNYEEVAFLLMTTHLKYFEMHILSDVTGWGEGKNQVVLNSLMSKGYFKEERPRSRSSMWQGKVYRVAYKYYPTHKHDMYVQKLENGFEKILNAADDKANAIKLKPKKVKGSPKI